ncbi:MAG: RloB family protein [Dysgonamonadaceae bacterium]|nr:RloB family protein [Dysgonamonadaceae bacterium]
MRRRQEADRSGGHRKRNPVVYIICEGEKTEIKYFTSYRTRDSMITIEPLPSKHQAAKALVEHAASKVSHLGYDERDGDEIWCVFDRDNNTDEDLQAAEQLAARHGYRIAYSNPSFELWYLFHFVDQRSMLADSDAVERLLDMHQRLPGYDKVKDYSARLLPYRTDAIRRAQQRLDELAAESQRLIRRGGNPYTTVHVLVQYLLERSMRC